jgi:hypothetical protein
MLSSAVRETLNDLDLGAIDNIFDPEVTSFRRSMASIANGVYTTEKPLNRIEFETEWPGWLLLLNLYAL